MSCGGKRKLGRSGKNVRQVATKRQKVFSLSRYARGGALPAQRKGVAKRGPAGLGKILEKHVDTTKIKCKDGHKGPRDSGMETLWVEKSG